jgi:hypothetical protein
LSDGEKITLTIHGLVDFHGEVDGEVFAEKLSAFIRGLAIADTAANGERRHKFFVADLVKNTATASLQERLFRTGAENHSGIEYFGEGVDQIRGDSQSARLLPEKFVSEIVKLNRDAEKKFQFGEIKRENGEVIRIDQFLAERAERVLKDIKRAEEIGVEFEGVAYGSFDGVLKAIDFQPEMKRGVLWLSAGGRPINCNITNLALDDVTAAVEKRCVVYGLAHYDRKSKLPRLIDIQKVELVPQHNGDLARWRGAFLIEPQSDNWGDH